MRPSNRKAMAHVFVQFALVLLFVSTQTFAQQTAPTANNGFMRTDLISPSPTAANLGKYGNVPLTYYTGLPNVSIPIFNVEGSDLKLPITLTYNYNGFKPAEEASWVGLGWSLQAGGVITRTLGDKLDEQFTGSYKYEKTVNLEEVGNQTYLKQAYKQAMYDLQPDVFSFNFAGYSGKFVLYNGQAYLMPYQKLQITGGTGGFTITTEDGTKYEFIEQEISAGKNTGFEPYIIPSYKSAWYLTKITNASGTESIRLEYATEGPIYQHGMITQSYTKYITGSMAGEGSTPSLTSQITSPAASFSTKVQTAKRLSAIYSDKYTVVFSPGQSRGDIDGTAYSLGEIKIYAGSRKLKSFKFETEYFGNGTAHSTRYLKLKRLLQYDGTGGTYMAHDFEYENEYGFYANAYDSYVDHYGYLKAPSTVPNSVYFPDPIIQNGPNRDPVFSSTKQGALKKIKYPTGGTSELQYESNTYYDGENYYYDYYYNHLPFSSVKRNASPTTVQRTDTFSTNYDQEVTLIYSRVPKITPTEGVVEVDHSSVREILLERVLLDDDGNFDAYVTVSNHRINYNSENGGKIEKLQLPGGIYRVTAYCDPTETEVTVSIGGYKRFAIGPIEGKLGAGIRIKSITENPVIGTPIVRKYYYANDEGFSHGKGLGEPAYKSQGFVKKFYNEDMAFIGEAQFIDYTSVVSEGPDTGLPFYYKEVTEDVVSGNEISRTKYFFNHIPGFNDADLMRQVDYKQENGTFIKVKEVENTYKDIFLDVFTGINVFRTEESYHEASPAGDAEYIYDYSPTAQYSLWKFIQSTKETQYSGNESLTTDITYHYDVANTRNLIGVRKTNSDGSSFYTKYKYVSDYTNAVGGNLATGKLYSILLEEQLWRKTASGDSVMLSGRINKYNSLRKIEKIYSFESLSGKTALSNETKTDGLYNTLISDDLYKTKIDFTYHNSGKLIGQQLTNDIPVSYLWGYAANEFSGSSVLWNNYPVAEIKNALPAEVFYTSFEEQSGSAVDTKTGIQSFTGAYAIPGSFIGEYTLTYWKKTGTAEWQLVEGTYTNPSNITIGDANSVIDEVRLYPSKATITTYTYFPGIGLSSVNDANNSVSYFKYDEHGRLKSIKDDKGNIRNTYQYQYVNSGGTIAVE
jgi:YD repeat-containing protein